MSALRLLRPSSTRKRRANMIYEGVRPLLLIRSNTSIGGCVCPDRLMSAGYSKCNSCELPHPTALGATRPSLVEGGASCFPVALFYPTEGHRERRLHRRLLFTSGSECPTPTESTLSHNRRCTLLVAFKHRRRRGEHLTTWFDRLGGKSVELDEKQRGRRCIPSLLCSLSAVADCGAPWGRGLSIYNSSNSTARI